MILKNIPRYFVCKWPSLLTCMPHLAQSYDSALFSKPPEIPTFKPSLLIHVTHSANVYLMRALRWVPCLALDCSGESGRRALCPLRLASQRNPSNANKSSPPTPPPPAKKTGCLHREKAIAVSWRWEMPSESVIFPGRTGVSAETWRGRHSALFQAG